MTRRALPTVMETGSSACCLLSLPLALALPGASFHPGCCTFFSKSGSLKVKRNLRTCSDRSLSMLLASMARPRNSSTSSSGFALSWAFLGARGTDSRHTDHQGAPIQSHSTHAQGPQERPSTRPRSALIRGREAETEARMARSPSPLFNNCMYA